MHEIKADAKLYLRIDTPNIGSDWPLSGKFGAGAAETREIVATAAKLGADLAGVTFHVGSQCRNPENWRVGIEKARKPVRRDAQGGPQATPARHRRRVPGAPRQADPVDRDDRRGRERGARGLSAKTSQVIAEPGRYLVSDAGYFVCRVVGTTTRGGKRWMYWDAGLFGGVIETTEGLQVQHLHRPLGTRRSVARGRADLRLGGRGDAR